MRRRPAATLLVLAALVALVAVALVPRGLVRAAAAQHLPSAPAADETQLVDLAEDLHLPGVRAVVGKEEDDALAEPASADAAVPAPAAPSPPAHGASTAPPLPGSPDAPDGGGPAAGRAPPQTV